jgi:hypothetical protein
VIWEVRRVIGGDYWLRVIGGNALLQGQAQPLAQWYDQMKAGVKLVPMQGSSIDLEAGEILWMKSRSVKLLQEILADNGLYISRNRNLGSGQLFLTNQRLIWTSGRDVHPFRLRQLIAAWPIGPAWRLAIQYENAQVYKLCFAEESALKWLTYIAMAAQHIEEAYGHKIKVSNY